MRTPPLVVRPLSLIVLPNGANIYCERSFVVSAEDEGGGIFVQIRSQGNGEQRLAIDPHEWPALREAIDNLLKEW